MSVRQHTVRAALVIACLGTWPGVAAGHTGNGALIPFPWVVLPLALVLLLYIRGALRSRRLPPSPRTLCFLAGWAVLTAALVGPLEHWAHTSLTGHMSQHMILILLAPPLLVLARPLPVLLRGMPAGIARLLQPLAGRLYGRSAGSGLAAFLAHGLTIWIWHLPGPYQLALASQPIHDLEHAMFLFTSLWFWWTLLVPARQGGGDFGPACLWAVLTVMHTGMLGALLTFAPALLYPAHPGGWSGLSPLEDQQLAGLVMWVPGGIGYTVAALTLCMFWLGRNDPIQRNGGSSSSASPPGEADAR